MGSVGDNFQLKLFLCLRVKRTQLLTWLNIRENSFRTANAKYTYRIPIIVKVIITGLRTQTVAQMTKGNSLYWDSKKNWEPDNHRTNLQASFWDLSLENLRQRRQPSGGGPDSPKSQGEKPKRVSVLPCNSQQQLSMWLRKAIGL